MRAGIVRTAPCLVWNVRVTILANYTGQKLFVDSEVRKNRKERGGGDRRADSAILAALEEEDAEYEAWLAATAFAEAVRKQRAGQIDRTSGTSAALGRP